MTAGRSRRAWLYGIAMGVGIALAAIVLLVVIRGGSGGTDPAGLKVGDCFDVPTATDRIGDLRRHPCNEAHGGEVFHVFDSAPASAYPSDRDWESLVYPVCDPVFESYTGTPVADRLDIEYRYLVPTADRWASGDRRVTCFITSPDGAPLSKSFRAAP